MLALGTHCLPGAKYLMMLLRLEYNMPFSLQQTLYVVVNVSLQSPPRAALQNPTQT